MESEQLLLKVGTLDSDKIIEIDIIEQQSEIWLACMLGDDTAKKSYNISQSIFLNGTLNINALEKAFVELIERHQSLRTTFSNDGSKMLIHPKMVVDIHFEDMTYIFPATEISSIEELCRSCSENIFDLNTGPLFHITLAKLAPNRYFLNFTAHHIICDGYSLGIIFEDLGNLYSSYFGSMSLETAESLLEFTEEEQIFYKSDYYQEIENYWLNQFKNEITPLQLPIDNPYPKNRSFSGGRQIQRISPELISELKEISIGAKCSLLQTIRVLFEVFIYRITGQRDLTIGQLVSGQTLAGFDNLVGHFVNLLPIRSSIQADLSFIDFLQHRRSELLEMYNYQQYTLGSLLKKISIQRSEGHSSLVSVLFNSTVGLDRNLNFLDLKVQHYDFYSGYEKFDLSFKVIGNEINPRFEWNYNSRLFREDTISRFMTDFEDLIRGVTTTPDTKIDAFTNPAIQLGMLSNETDAVAKQSILDLFRMQVKSSPTSTALIFKDAKITYQDLDYRSSQLANYIISQRLNCSLIPLIVNPSLDMIISILAILKSKCAYIPIDPSFPKERISAIIRDSQAEFLVCDDETKKIIHDFTSINLFNIQNDISFVKDAGLESKHEYVKQEDFAYVIYTSGSTGKPKGVVVNHSNLIDYVDGLASSLPIHECKNFILSSTIATDLGNTTLFSSLATGGTLHITSKEDFNNILYIHQYFEDHKIDFLKIVPSHWQSLKNGDRGLFPKKLLVFGGETLTVELATSIYQSNDRKCVIVNHYGPTETTIGKLLHIIDFERFQYNRTIPIGRPFSNTRAYILNKDKTLCPIGIPGELYISGSGVAHGYLHDEKLTNDKFLSDPFTSQSERMYRTGDLVRCLNNGQIEFLGRIDHQIKIRGNRVEIGDIENAILSCPSVKQCHVHIQNQDDVALIAFIVPSGTLDEKSIYKHLKNQLPKCMLPNQIIPLERIPLTANGKVDTKALPFIKKQQSLNTAYCAPISKLEKDLAYIWQNCLNIQQVGITDNFFDLGGHSLIAVKIILAIEQKFNKRIPLASLFENSTIKELAKLLSDHENKIKWDCLVPIKTTGNKTPIYLVHGDGLNVLTFKPIAKYLDPEQPLYALQALGLNGDRSRLLYSMEEIAVHYSSEILESNPDGPYILGGYSFGGLLAFEIARKLIEQGKKVEMLAILDTNCSNRNNYSSTSARITRKIFRQIHKSIFIVGNLIHRPKQTIDYQLKFIRSKVFRKSSKNDEKNNFFSYDPEINRSYRIAKNDYKMTPLNIGIHLFKTKDRVYFVDDGKYYGWQRYALGGVRTHFVPGDHKTFLFEPNVKDFSNLLQLAINSGSY